jgi:hypothetical protein
MYLDGNGNAFYRKLQGNGTEQNPHIPVISVNENLLNENSLKTTPVSKTEDIALTSGSGSPATIRHTIDCRIYKSMFMRVVNTHLTTAFTGFSLDLTATDPNSNIWDTIADSDYFFTTGTGENEGIAAKVIQRVGNNPRTLAANTNTWMYLNLVYVPWLRINITGVSARLIYTLMG